MPKKKPVNLDFAFELEPAAAMKYFRSKGHTLSWDWHDTLGEAHAAAFTVAHVARMDILQDIRGAVDAAIADGQTFAEFRKNLEPTLKKKGWWGKNKRINPNTGEEESILEGSPHRLRTIYHTNMKSAYNAGREEFFQRNKKNRPYGQFVAVMDPKTRDEHGRLHNKVFHLDDPFWDRFTPPIDYNCRCRKRALSEAAAKRKGLKILSSEGKLVREDRLVSKKSGELRPTWGYKLPGGDKIFPQVGFDHNQWKAAYQPDLEKYDYDIAKKYVEGTVTGPGFKRFFEGEAGGSFPIAVLNPQTRKLTGQKKYQAVKIKKKSKMKHIRKHGISVEDMGMVQEIIDDGTVIEPYADKTERQFFLKKGGTYYALPLHRKKDGLWADTFFTFPAEREEYYLKKKIDKGKILRRQKK